ncbi:hypothetical protein EYF80_025185 [Liparis tanakae]|uniref:Uncharacterized protein n=1 Tax=Liparis tanakae TaxID=230148 RepID=A0A4Z2HFA9_9TELE|nr:hypothetical protein EYF80_025185 [Liparis tanakae]
MVCRCFGSSPTQVHHGCKSPSRNSAAGQVPSNRTLLSGDKVSQYEVSRRRRSQWLKMDAPT